MKQPFIVLLAASSITMSSAFADTNIALPAQTNGGTAIFGYNGSTLLGIPYDHAGGTGNLNDGVNDGPYGDDSYPVGNNVYVGAEFTLAAGKQVNSLVFYGRNFGDGGWFGTSGVGPLGAGSTLTAANLVVPTLQYTVNGGATWVNDSFVTNDYVAQFTGSAAGGGAATKPATFTLTKPLTGIDGLRLIGNGGGTAGVAPTGFLGADEIQVLAGPVTVAPEPSTWLMMLAGLAFLGFRLRRKAGFPNK